MTFEELPFDVKIQICSVSTDKQDFNMRVATASHYNKLFPEKKNATTICSCKKCIHPVQKPIFD